ncbi:MAG: TRAP transporter small permease subunit [Dehalococcoidales bacterium]|nr:TRAP transporter small permease subunit [Dehalococcoidales bacterium]
MFNRVMQKLDHWVGCASRTLILVSGILILLMAWVETYGVVKRYVFNAPDPLAYEISTMFLLFCGVLAVAGVERLDRHVRNDLVASRFPSMIKAIVLSTIFPFLALIFCAVLTWKSLDNALYALQIGQVSQSPWALPLAPIKLVIPLGYTLLCLVLLGKFFKGIALLRGGKNQDQTEQW